MENNQQSSRSGAASSSSTPSRKSSANSGATSALPSSAPLQKYKCVFLGDQSVRFVLVGESSGEGMCCTCTSPFLLTLFFHKVLQVGKTSIIKNFMYGVFENTYQVSGASF